MSGSILVSGAAGTLGKRVLERLLARKSGDRIVATTRKPEALAAFAAQGVDVRRADFDDEAGLATAFAGVERALLISTDSLDKPGHRVQQHAAAIRSLEAAGAKHVIYTSMPNPQKSRILIAKDHADTEALLAKSSLGYTVLRNNIYSEMLLPGLERAVASGKLVDAREGGKLAYVTRDDCAAIAAAVLAEPPAGNQILDVTGAEALGSAQIAELVTQLSGRKIEHISIPLQALTDGMVEHGLPRPVAEIYASFDAGVAAGELDLVSDHVARFTGKKPQSFADFLRANPSAWAVA
jgi:NAD(P)H dehydrogenase (quinone)